MSDAVDVLLHEVLGEIRALRADVEALASRGRLTKDERATLADLYREAAPVFGAKAFTTSDVFDWPTLAPLVADYTPSSLSWILSRAERVTLAGLRAERIGAVRPGTAA